MNIISLFFNLCLFKVDPSEIPVSRKLLKTTLLLYFILGVVINLINNNGAISVILSVADVAVMLLMVAIALRFKGLQSRYLQVTTALAGAGSCVAIVGIPIIGWFYQLDFESQSMSPAMIFMMALLFWSLMVTAHILRYSLDIKPGTATMITVFYILSSLIISALLVGLLGGAA